MDAVIFDFDGVLVDSERYWDDVDRRFFGELIPGWTAEDGDQMSGLSGPAGYERLTQIYGFTMPWEEYSRRMLEASAPIYDALCQPLPGVGAFLERLSERRMPIAIGSSSRRERIRTALIRLGMDRFFPVICTAEDVERGKPFPDVYLLAASRLGANPARCLVIEDSCHGVRAAKAAGMTCVGIRTDMNPRQDLSEADREIRDFAELEALLFPR